MNQPPVAITPAVFPRRDRDFAPQVSAIVAESVRWAEPTPPVRYGDFWNVGKDTRHAWPHRYVYETDNSRSTLAIMALPEQTHFPTIASALVVGMDAMTPHQAQNPKASPVAIVTPKQGSFGAQRELAPLVGYNAQYAKLVR